MTYTTGGDIRVTRSSNLAQWAQTGVQVWAPNGQDYGAIWAPELHRVNGSFYIYAALTRASGDNRDHRMYAFRGRSTTDPTQPFDVSQINCNVASVHLAANLGLSKMMTPSAGTPALGLLAYAEFRAATNIRMPNFIR